ncbi:MAG: hypothetical protein FRX49_00941 [Trebouxia sp. A1-2]|nr:MAG: hypothetical protein FRX49_00941 [Trebouxia sp. A1-2]
MELLRVSCTLLSVATRCADLFWWLAWDLASWVRMKLDKHPRLREVPLSLLPILLFLGRSICVSASGRRLQSSSGPKLQVYVCWHRKELTCGLLILSGCLDCFSAMW